MNAETKLRRNADDRGIEGATMTGEEMGNIRGRAGLSIYELASLLRYRDIDGLRRMETGSRPISGPVQLVMELIRDGKLDADAELQG